MTRSSSLQALKTLKAKPHWAAEVPYKLRAHVKNRVLVKLTDFLELPKVKEAGITLQNAQIFISPAPLHLVANLNS